MTDKGNIDLGVARTRLESERDRVRDLLSEVHDNYETDGGISQSGDAGADTTYADASHGLQDALKRELGEIDAALERLDNGSYGVDEKTGEPIDPARLEAEPTARTNVGS